jgi:single-strand DNA-binding protein
MKSINRVTLLGRLGRDAVVSFTATGKAVTKFSVATESFWKDKEGQPQKKTNWTNIVIWSNTPLLKGQAVMVEGRIETRDYDKGGTKIYVTEVIADTVLVVVPESRDNRKDEQLPQGTPVVHAPMSEEAPF